MTVEEVSWRQIVGGKRKPSLLPNRPALFCGGGGWLKFFLKWAHVVDQLLTQAVAACNGPVFLPSTTFVNLDADEASWIVRYTREDASL